MTLILIAEDEPRIASFLEKGLRASGFATVIADTGTLAAGLLRQQTFDLLILDLGLPGKDGHEVLQELRRRGGNRLPVIIFTARDGMRHPGQVLSRQQLLDLVWGYAFDPGSNVVDVYVRYLRQKLGTDVIETARGMGYRLKG